MVSQGSVARTQRVDGAAFFEALNRAAVLPGQAERIPSAPAIQDLEEGQTRLGKSTGISAAAGQVSRSVLRRAAVELAGSRLERIRFQARRWSARTASSSSRTGSGPPAERASPEPASSNSCSPPQSHATRSHPRITRRGVFLGEGVGVPGVVPQG